MQYDGWPLARFLEREHRAAQLPQLAEAVADAEQIEVWLEREAWQAAARPAILERSIGPVPPVPLRALDARTWGAMVSEALDCFDAERGYRGRARQTVTLVRAGRAESDVTPHLQFKVALNVPLQLTAADWVSVVRGARAWLQPMHDFVSERSRG
jgi:hypothetical protein